MGLVIYHRDDGRVAEWLMAPVLKTGVPERVSGVRIPPLPPFPLSENVPRHRPESNTFSDKLSVLKFPNEQIFPAGYHRQRRGWPAISQHTRATAQHHPRLR